MKNCERIQNLILESKTDSEVISHLAECPECREFEQFNRELMALESPALATPSLNSILVRNIQLKQKRKKIYAAVASFVVVIGLSGILFPQEKLSKVTPMAVVNEYSDTELLTMSWDDVSDITKLQEDVSKITIASNWNISNQ